MHEFDLKSAFEQSRQGSGTAAYEIGRFFYSQPVPWAPCAAQHWLLRALALGHADAHYLLSCLHLEKKRSACIAYDLFEPDLATALSHATTSCEMGVQNAHTQKCLVLSRLGLDDTESYRLSFEKGLELGDDWCVMQYVISLLKLPRSATTSSVIAGLRSRIPQGRMTSYAYAVAALHGYECGDPITLARFSAQAGLSAAQWLLGRLLLVQEDQSEEGVRWLYRAYHQGMMEAGVTIADWLSTHDPDNPESDRLYFETAREGSLSARAVLAVRYFACSRQTWLTAATASLWMKESLRAEIPLARAWQQSTRAASCGL
ncbi:hypothetical protein [Asaia sp. As-1742]|uniref:hypothetical protein n=1 Tax=Asaia sp. As-1742 TaxID=2608325 RepID=UPI0014236D31|nr:hypothetical protein [Asaia sp. As-1742]NIE80120.1 hypothetical protein [Asaia sp. As-1742]